MKKRGHFFINFWTFLDIIQDNAKFVEIAHKIALNFENINIFENHFLPWRDF